VVGGFLRIDEETRVISDPVPARYPWDGPTDLMVAEPGSWRLHQVSTFFSKRALDEVGRFVDEGLRYVLDRELLNRVCRRFPVVTSKRVYAAFRHHTASKSTAESLPFSRELAALHLRDVPLGEAPAIGRRRRALVRRQLAAGYLKLANLEGAGLGAMRALIRAIFEYPPLVLNRSFWVKCLEATGTETLTRRIVGKPRAMFVPRPLSEVVHEL
jgi:hypothetical protein